MRVWVVETGEYDSMVWSVATTPSVAAEAIKQQYAPPYVVTWEPVEEVGDRAILRGHFTAIPGLSTTHTATYVMREFELVEEPVRA